MPKNGRFVGTQQAGITPINDTMYNRNDNTHYFAWSPPRRARGPLESRLFNLRRGKGSRIGHHVTEPMLAKLLGCSVPHYQRMERGIHPFKDAQLHKLADYYGVDADELLHLRSVEQLLLHTGFPKKNPAPLLWEALEFIEDSGVF